MDAVNKKILALLQEDGRLTVELPQYGIIEGTKGAHKVVEQVRTHGLERSNGAESDNYKRCE